MTEDVPRPALEAMLEAKSVAVVGASTRPASFGRRCVDEILKSPSEPEIHFVNPGYTEIEGRPCVASLDDLPGAVDLVLLGVPDAALESELTKAANRGDRSAVIFGSAFEPPTVRPLNGDALGSRLAAIATDAGMALCGAGCMGFINVSYGLHAIGYVEPDPIPSGPLALVSCSGSAFSAMLRTDRRFGWTIAVSSGQELVTPAAAYIDYTIGLEQTKVVAVILEAIHDPDALTSALRRAAAAEVVVVALTVGRTEAGKTMVAAHSGALAGSDAAWEALFDRHGVVRVNDLDEMADTVELFCSRRRPAERPRKGGGVATVHDSGAERALAVDLASDLGLNFAVISDTTEARLEELLDPGLIACNPLDLWGTGADTADRFRDALLALAEDPEVEIVALSVDLVHEYDGDDSYEKALVDARVRTPKPLVLLSNLAAAVDPPARGEAESGRHTRARGTRAGMLAMRHLLEWRDARERPDPKPQSIDSERRRRWSDRIGRGRLTGTESLELLADYGIQVTRAAQVTTREDAIAQSIEIGLPVVLKTDVPGIDHKSDVGGVLVGLETEGEVGRAYDDLARRIGPEVMVAEFASDGVEVALGIVRDLSVGPIVMVGAGGVLVEYIADRSVALPPVDMTAAQRMIESLGIRALLDGTHGGAPSDIEALARALVSISVLATELDACLEALDVNPLRCGPAGAVALDTLVVPASLSAEDQKIT